MASSDIFPSCRSVEGPRPGSNNQPRWTSARRAPSVRPLQCSRASLKRFALLTLVALWLTWVKLLPSSISLWSTVRTVIRRLFHPAEMDFRLTGWTGGRSSHGWALGVVCSRTTKCILGGFKNVLPKVKTFVFPKVKTWMYLQKWRLKNARWPELGLSCLVFCLFLCVSSCVLFRIVWCSCILAMRKNPQLCSCFAVSFHSLGSMPV